MKNEKFCFSKGTGLIALVGVLLVGFVLANQMVINTKTSINSRAGGGTGTSSVSIPAAGTLVLSELKTRASQVLAVPGIEAAQTNATGAFTAVTSQLNASSTAIDKIISQITADQSANNETVQADLKTKKDAVDAAIATTKTAQTAANYIAASEDDFNLTLRKAEEDVKNNLVALVISKNAFVDALNTVMVNLIPVIDKDMRKKWIDMINAVSEIDEIGYKEVLDKISKDSGKVIGLEFKPFESVLKKSKPVRTAHTDFVKKIDATTKSKKLLADLKNDSGKFQILKDAKAAQVIAEQNYRDAQNNNTKVIASPILTEANGAKIRIAAETLLVNETNVLPAGITGVVIPANLKEIDRVSFQLVQQEIDKVNTSIANANAAYTAFDSAISGVTIPANTTSGGVTPGVTIPANTTSGGVTPGVTIPANTTSGGVTPGVLTCKQQGGDYYKDIDCKTLQDRMKTLFKDAVAPKDQKYWPNRVCCIGVKRTL